MRPSADRASGKSKLIAARRVIAALIAPAVLIAAWEIYPKAASVSDTVLPTPSLVLRSMWEVRGVAWVQTKQTLFETAIGFVLSVAVAVLLAIIMDALPWLRHGLYPMLVASQTIPVIAIAPLMIIWFGFGVLPKVLIVILVTFFPVVVALLDGFASTDAENIKLVRTMGASSWQIFFRVRFPSGLPYLFTGLRIAVTYAVTAAIVAEYVGAQSGLGIWMLTAKSAFRTDLVFAAIVITAVLTAILFLIVSIAGRMTIPWYYAERKYGR